MENQSSNAVTNVFNKGMVKDFNDTFIGEGMWTHARNAVNNSHDGQVGVIGNEPANLHCINLPYTFIGAIHLIDDQWAIFTTDEINSEIGIFDESLCSYEKIINSPCLNFRKSNLITGVYRKRFDCERLIYWDDKRNPTRYINLDDVKSFCKYTETVEDGCVIKHYTNELDCEKIRLSPIIQHPCVSLQKGKGAGTLANGSYQICLAYTINQVRITDYIGLSEIQSVFTHQNLSSSLEARIISIDKNFDEFELVIISNINHQTVAKRLGYYSTSQGIIYIDSISPELVTVPLTQVALRTEPIEKSDAMYNVNNYLLRVGTHSKFKFNYQQQANKIQTKWVAVQYPSTYYAKGGNNPSFMRDEQYAFFIRWVYNTGDKSESYHIPGRQAEERDMELVFGGDAFETFNGEQKYRWEVENTASIESFNNTILPDGGIVIATGKMGYWESKEYYPDNVPEIWGDLCGKHIRHHKMPDVTIEGGEHINHFNSDGSNIVILGVQFENITHPLDINGQPIESVVGYEILRGSREGNKTIIATGIFNNMREYTIPEGTLGITGLYQNYPYNDLRADYYLTSNEDIIKSGSFNNRKDNPLTKYRKDIFSFHSPDTTFTEPFLNVSEVKLYGEVYGESEGFFDAPWKHPKNKFIGEDVEIINKILQIISIINSLGNDNFPPGSVELIGTEDMPIKMNLVPKEPEKQSTLFGSILGGIVNIFAPGAGDIVAGTIDSVAYGISVAGYEAQMLVVKYINTEATSAQLQLLVYGLIPKKQYAAQYNSHGYYNKFKKSAVGDRRKKIEDSLYVKGNVQGFSKDFRINNLYRGNFVVIRLNGQTLINNPTSVVDDSRVLLSDINVGLRKSFKRNISSHYGAIKIPLYSQYGQLESIKQIPISVCIGKSIPNTSTSATSDILFGGDVYINKFTEKNSMFFFNNWMIDLPDETDFDYRDYINVPYPRYWMNTAYAEYKLLNSTASERHHLDKTSTRFFYINEGYVYLFNSGVREFFVESEINLAYRDWEDELSKRHYDDNSFTDLNLLFRSDIIQSGNYCKYDYSLSVSKLYNNFISWGNLLPRSYNSHVYNSCYVYRPNRVIYSLRQEDELNKDNWRLFLANNYRDFQSGIISIKPIGKNGALFMMNDQSPIQFVGVDQLETDAGTKITIGDGGLFQQPLQNLVNSDVSLEYASCQSRYAVIGTIHGIFWVSQNQGKVFQYAGNLNEISRNGMKWWFSKYLPSELLKVYPNYPHYDNPVKGIGVQIVYDNTNEIVYITKKDYKPKRTDLLWDDDGGFYYEGPNSKTILTCPPGYTLKDGMCVANAPSCPDGYVLIDGVCTKTESISPIASGTVVPVTRTPWDVYGNMGTKVYEYASLSSPSTLLNTSNLFWIRQPNPPEWGSMTPEQKQAFDLNNGPVNRLAVWGNPDGRNLNNYNHGGEHLLPINQWIGFDVCINVSSTKVYYVAIAADNEYRFSLDGRLILTNTTGLTSTFNYLHIYPITISAGNHILRLEGKNNGYLAGFGCEIYDLDNRPQNMSVVDFLNAQINYDNLHVIFTTRNATQFSSNLYSCPSGYDLANPTCNEAVCQKVFTLPPITKTVPPKTVVVKDKIYCNFDNGECWENASWTISYDPKNNMWVSFHDWNPNFLLPSKLHFLSIVNNSIWKHNSRCDKYANFYGEDYPFEIEYTFSTGQDITSVRNVEYILEAYKIHNDCKDKFHVLNSNFDQAIIYNSEQISGLLELELKYNPLDILKYPIVSPQSIKINYSKEEHKYRFNQFWDITKDRGEFNDVNIPMFITEPNGYKFQINPRYVNYNKPELERKKFRHDVNKIFLRKLRSDNTKYIFKISNQKLLRSLR